MNDIRVLLVDDETQYMETLMKRLKKRRIDIRGVDRGEKALETLSRHEVDVVVLDVKMPGMDGIEVLKRIKSQYPLIEVIMLTGHASMDVAMQGMQLGAFDYLVKPTDADELLYKIQDAIQHKTIEEAKQQESQEITEPESGDEP